MAYSEIEAIESTFFKDIGKETNFCFITYTGILECYARITLCNSHNPIIYLEKNMSTKRAIKMFDVINPATQLEIKYQVHFLFVHPVF